MAENQSASTENGQIGRQLGIGRPKPRISTPETGSSEVTTSSAYESRNDTAQSSGFQRRGFADTNNNAFHDRQGFSGGEQRGGYDRPRGGGRGGGGACYNCNQSGHMARDCPEPQRERREGGYQRGGFNQGGGRGDSHRGGFSRDGDRGDYNPRGGRGGFSRDGDRGDFNQSGGRSGFSRDGDRGDFNQSGGRGGFSRGGDRNDYNRGSGFRSATQGDNGSFSITVSNDKPSFSRGSTFSSGFSSGRPNNAYDGSNRQDHAPNNRGGFSSAGSGFRSEGRPDQSYGSDRTRSRDSEANQGPHGDGQLGPLVTYVPASAPTTEDQIFGAATTKGENFEKYHNARVTCTPEGKVKPIDLFDEANFPTEVLTNIGRTKFTDPTAIQRYTIPCIREKHDLMACAQTGSGKTAAFLLPIIANLLDYHYNDLSYKNAPPAPLALILSPTRELAQQTEREARKFAFNTPIIPCSVVGGHDIADNARRLTEGCHIVSATTGRLKDMVEKGRISLESVKYLVLDEADRMLDMSFADDIRKLAELGLKHKDERCTSMFSATFPRAVQQLAKEFLREDYVFLAVGSIGGANEDITQFIEEVPQSQKKERLFKLLTENLKDERCLIFVETKRSADYLGSLLSQKGFTSTTMHGDRPQQLRDEAVRQFTDGRCPILVATSVAARGLDFPLIGYVINYDLPDTTDFYIHRIGRTGRAGHLGKSISFFDPDRQTDRQLAPDLVRELDEAGQKVPDFLLRYTNENPDASNQSARAHNVDMRSRGHNFSGTRVFHSHNTQGGTTSAGAAQDEPW